MEKFGKKGKARHSLAVFLSYIPLQEFVHDFIWLSGLSVVGYLLYSLLNSQIIWPSLEINLLDKLNRQLEIKEGLHCDAR